MGGVFRAIFGYCFLIFMTRIVGRRPGTQMTPFDFIFVFFVGGLTLTPMVGNDRSLMNALSIITTIAATHYAITWAKQRYPIVGRIVDGTPLVVFRKGKWQDDALAGNLVPRDDVVAAVRQRGLRSMDDVEYVILERNGEFSVVEGTSR
jgi:uncharacterized membrane protein YcaP (DUF421 family)